MGEISSGCTFTRMVPQNTVMLLVETAATADNTDTIDITLADYGIATVEAILGFEHSTTDSIVITQAPTTSVSGGVLTINIGGSSTDKKYVFLIIGQSA